MRRFDRLERALGLEEQVLCQLLGQRRAALDDTAGPPVGGEGAGEADRIDTEMPIEAPVLDGDDGLREIGRYLVEGQGLAVVFAAGGDQRPVVGEDLDRRRPLRHLPLLHRRQPLGIIGDETGDADRTEEDKRDEAADRASDEAAEATTAAAARPAAAAVSGAARTPRPGRGASTSRCAAETVGLVEPDVEAAGGPFRLRFGRFPGGLADLSGHSRAAP
jgi:hypothetical protein